MGTEMMELNRATRIDNEIFSFLNGFKGAAYDSKAKMYETLVGSKLYNRIMWGTLPGDYKKFAENAIAGFEGTVLDIGCGGLVQTAAIYASTPRECILLDNSVEMLKIAKSRLVKLRGAVPGNIHLVQADSFNLPFPDECFDTVVSFGMIHLFDNKRDFVNESLRVLKQGGEFYFSSMTTKRRISKWYMNLLRKQKEFGEPCSRLQVNNLFNNRLLELRSYMVGSMSFIRGKKLHIPGNGMENPR